MPPDYLTQADVQNYGTDLVDFAQRACSSTRSRTSAAVHAGTE